MSFILNAGLQALEAPEAREKRLKIKDRAVWIQVASVAALVISIAITVFSVLLLAPVTTVLGGFGVILSYDIYSFSKKIEQLASKHTEIFSTLLKATAHLRNQQDPITAFRREILESTFLLKGLYEVCEKLQVNTDPFFKLFGPF